MKNRIPGTWEARFEGKHWRIFSDDGKLIATLTEAPDAEARAKMIAMSPYMLEALKGTVRLIGDEDLSDNGEVSGAAVCDLVRSAVTLVEES